MSAWSPLRDLRRLPSAARHSPCQSTKTPMLTLGVGGVTPVTSSWDLDGGCEGSDGIWGQHMFTQKTQSRAPMASKTGLRRSRKFVAIIASAALIILAAIGVYFAAFRSLPTARGPWARGSATVTTDSLGRFAATFKPHLTGSIVMRVVVGPAGRYLQVTGPSNPVRLLTLSSISLKGGGLVTNQIPVSFTVAVDPPSLGRTVKLEQSSDKVHWAPVGPSAQTQDDGTTVIRVPSLTIGVWSYRATVAQNDKFAASVSALASATVQDIKVVAAKAAARSEEHTSELQSRQYLV